MRKKFSIAGMVICALIVMFGLLMLLGAFEKKTGNKDADLVLDTLDELSSVATINRASGFIMIGFGLFGFCLFGVLMEVPKNETINNHSETKREENNVPSKPDSQTAQRVRDIAREMQTELGVNIPASGAPVWEKTEKKEINTLPEMLAYAGKFTSDSGMTGYLKREKDKLPEKDRMKVETLLSLTPARMREAIKKMTEEA